MHKRDQHSRHLQTRHSSEFDVDIHPHAKPTSFLRNSPETNQIWRPLGVNKKERPLQLSLR